MRIKYIVPFPLDAEGVRNREAQIPKELVRPGVEIKFFPVEEGSKFLDSYYEDLLTELFIFKEGLKAEKEGFDAVCIDTMSDSGLYPLRSRLKIPVIGPGQLTMHVAGIFGHKFSIITMWDKWIHLYEKTLNETGLRHKCASIRAIQEEPDLRNLFSGKEEETNKKLEALSLQCINEDGAHVIILGSTTMHQAYNYLKKRLPCPVINPGIWTFKFAEMLLELGVSHSKLAYPTPAAPRDASIFA